VVLVCFGKVMVWRWVGIGIFWFCFGVGSGFVLVYLWYSIGIGNGMVPVWYWHGVLVVLCSWYGIGTPWYWY